MTPKEIAELQLKAWEKTIEVQEHFNDIGLRIRNLFVTLLAATIAVAGYGIKAVQGPSTSVPLNALILPYMPVITLLGLFICVAFWFLDRLWYHRLLRGAVAVGEDLEKRLAKSGIGDIGLTTRISHESRVDVFGLRFDATLRLDFFYGLFAFALVYFKENIESAPGNVYVVTSIVAALLIIVAVWLSTLRKPKQ